MWSCAVQLLGVMQGWASPVAVVLVKAGLMAVHGSACELYNGSFILEQHSNERFALRWQDL